MSSDTGLLLVRAKVTYSGHLFQLTINGNTQLEELFTKVCTIFLMVKFKCLTFYL